MKDKAKSLLHVMFAAAVCSPLAVDAAHAERPTAALFEIEQSIETMAFEPMELDIKPDLTLEAPALPSMTQYRMNVFDYDPEENWDDVFGADYLSDYELDSTTVNSFLVQDFRSHWQDALDRHESTQTDKKYKSQKKKWDRFVAKQSGKTAEEKIENVNDYFNKYTPDYRIRNGQRVLDYMISGLDQRLYGGEYFAAPLETMKNRAGDCDDYVVAKYLALKELGFHEDDLRFAIVENTTPISDDENSTKRPLHAVLLVNTADGLYVLDNNAPYLSKEDDNTKYKMLYTMNEQQVDTYRRHTAPPVKPSI